MTKILLVCRANICRSPMALAITQWHVAQAGAPGELVLCAAGTHAVGSPIDPRAARTLQRHGYPAPGRRARTVQARDFKCFDQILAMDCSNLSDLQHLCPQEQQHKLGLFLRYANAQSEREIPDPYFGGPLGFERVIALCEAAARGLLQALADRPFIHCGRPC